LVVHCGTLNNDYYDCNTADLKYTWLSSVRMPTQDNIHPKNILDEVHHMAVKEILLK